MPRIQLSLPDSAFAGVSTALCVKRTLRRLLGGLLLATSCAVPAGVVAVPNAVWVFGDSFSDAGNMFALTNGFFPYPSGRFSNGPVWVEQFANSLGLTAIASANSGTNFAVGGAQAGTGSTLDPLFPTLPDTGMRSQVDLFLGAGGAANDAFNAGSLFVIHTAGNDYQRWTNLADVNQMQTVVDDTVQTLGGLITDLHNEAGAMRFLVPNMHGFSQPDDWVYGSLPTFREFSQTFNTALAAEVNDLRSQLGVTIIEVDLFALFDQMLANPSSFGFTDVATPCLNLSASLGFESLCANPDEHLYWDALHPTTRAHQFIADAALAAVVPLPATLPLFAGALWVLAGARRFRSAFAQ